MACPACISCPASRQVADAHDTRMMIIKADPIWSVGTHCWQPCQYWATSDQTCLSRPPARINHYANNILQYVSNCLVSLVPDPPQIWMNAAISLSIIPTLAPASEARAPYVEARVALLDLYQWTRVWMIQWMTDWPAAPTHP